MLLGGKKGGKRRQEGQGRNSSTGQTDSMGIKKNTQSSRNALPHTLPRCLRVRSMSHALLLAVELPPIPKTHKARVPRHSLTSLACSSCFPSEARNMV